MTERTPFPGPYSKDHLPPMLIDGVTWEALPDDDALELAAFANFLRVSDHMGPYTREQAEYLGLVSEELTHD